MNKIIIGQGIKPGTDRWSFTEEGSALIPMMVLSHSCEIDKENDIKLTSIILAPLRDINKITHPDMLEQLKQSNLISEETERTFLKYFYLEANEQMPDFTGGAVVDFSKCFSMRKTAYDYLRDRKILQLQPAIANQMALKLSLYFYRT
ncbi:MAG: hypothetical protein KDD51_07995 [Bdellovibrionales bacterium]|nr:hypothetical protein [Bdellovibrionales bacterium]